MPEATRRRDERLRPVAEQCAQRLSIGNPEDARRHRNGDERRPPGGPRRLCPDFFRSGAHLAWIEEDVAAGFDEIYLHQCRAQSARIIEVFGGTGWPRVRAS
ncbi:hypothetical protein F2981_25760 (plasmid) [Sinorhizobium meliloti]|nr:hypothetical protein [Sinorhizobium meliloti]